MASPAHEPSSREEIESRIPHRAPMLLVDEIVEEDETSIVARKTFREDEHFVQGHYPGNPIVPGVILCECGAQTGALFLAKRVGDAAGVPVLTRLSDARFKHIVRPGDTVEIQVRLDEQLQNAFFMTAKLLVAGKTAVRFQFACALADAESP